MDKRKIILQAAEKQFEKNGFDATSVASIAKLANCNKALIYYYFKDKDDLIRALFADILDGMRDKAALSADSSSLDLASKIASEATYLTRHKRVLKLLFSEALRDGKFSESLFDLADIVIEAELQRRGFSSEKFKSADDERNQVLAHEFFTGIIPVLVFVTLGARWQKRLGISSEEANAAFMAAFKKSHLATHIEPTKDDKNQLVKTKGVKL